jgi:hypothetical protein
MFVENKSTPAQLSGWQEGFLSLLPAIHNQVHFAFRKLPLAERHEAVHEGVCNALVAYQRLVQRGRQSLAYATPLARYAVRQVRDGRRVGTRQNINDVMSTHCQRPKGINIRPLLELDKRTGRWRDLLVEDRRTSPADIVALKLDFQQFLNSLAPRKRAITESLASGEPTRNVARLFRVSAARVSQIRRELESLWNRFQDEPAQRLSAVAV